MYACDCAWWDKHIASVRERFTGECWSQDHDAARRHGLAHIFGLNEPGLSTEPGCIHNGGNSGYQAIGLAWQFGAARVLLIGYDMQPTAGRRHWFGDHPQGLQNAVGLEEWAPRFDALAAGLAAHGTAVINCSRETAIAAFPRGDLECCI